MRGVFDIGLYLVISVKRLFACVLVHDGGFDLLADALELFVCFFLPFLLLVLQLKYSKLLVDVRGVCATCA